jgi:[acyl-carrier-protein] S-malonyltransferase
VSARIVASVADTRITTADLEDRLAALRSSRVAARLPSDTSPDGLRLRRWLVQDLVEEAVIAHEARGLGVAHDGEDALEAVRERVTEGVEVPEAAVRDYYERNADLYRQPEVRRIRQLRSADRDIAEAALRLATDAGTFEAIGTWEALALRRGELSGPLEEALFAAAPGAAIGPIRTELGWHVAILDSVEPAAAIPYCEVRDAIFAELLADARSRAFREWLDARRRALAVIEPFFEHPAHPAHADRRHRH